MLQRGLLKKLLVGQMAMQGINMATIEFFKSTFDILSSEKGVGCPGMSKVAYVSRQNANRHARRLEEKGYLIRCNYRAWRVSDHAITDPDFLFLASNAGMAA